jgi:hypothetical protein
LTPSAANAGPATQRTASAEIADRYLDFMFHSRLSLFCSATK